MTKELGGIPTAATEYFLCFHLLGAPLRHVQWGSTPDRLFVRPAQTVNIIFKQWFTSAPNYSQAATPGYFTSTFVNGIKLETTSTRRAGLIRFTYPAASGPNHVVVDLTNDLQRSFSGGAISVSPDGRVKLDGTFLQVTFRSSLMPKEPSNY